MKDIYLDYQATTPCDPRVVEAMLPYFTDNFGNPHSNAHRFGWNASKAVEEARSQIAQAINADAKDIIFTSGATESNNLALKGVAHFYKDRGNHIITSVIEHKCILNACKQLEAEGFNVTYLPVTPSGLVDLDELAKTITPQTILVSIMAVNNEMGVIEPVSDIGALCRQKGVFFHTDAAQGLGKIKLDVEAMNVDLMSLSAHKAYGPKGIGALYIRRKPRVRVRPVLHGGDQERGIRGGTLPVPLCVGFGKACDIVSQEFDKDIAHITGLSARFYQGLFSNLPHIYLNGDRHKRVPHNLNISFAGIEGEGLMMKIKGIAVSSGSACTSATLEPSYVLRALGIDDNLIHTSLRFGFGRFTTVDEIDYAIKNIIESVNTLRSMSPLWEMMESGVDLKKVSWHDI